MLSELSLFIFPVLLLVAAVYDVSSYRIPNWISVALLAGYVPLAILAGLPWVEMGYSLLAGLLVLVIGMGLFAFRIVGGGDAKLLAAAALWVGMSGLLQFVVAVALIGGLFGIVLITFRKFPLPGVLLSQGWIVRLHASDQGIPYGVAICIGGILTFQDTTLFKLLVH